MSKDKKKKSFSNEEILLATGVALFVIFVVIIVSSFMFLAQDVLPAITSRDSSEDTEEIFFNLEGFEQLNL